MVDIIKTAMESPEKANSLPNPDKIDVGAWLEKVKDQKDAEKDFRKMGKKVVKIFEANEGAKEEKDQGNWQYNILFSNTDTMMPALYSQVPRPVVLQNYKKEDPLSKAGADLMQQLLKFLVENDTGECETFDSTMKHAVLGALLPGRGITKYKYDAEFETVAGPETGETESSDEETAEGETPAQQASESYEKVTSEWVEGEDIPWDHITLGPGYRWNKIPWIAIDHYMRKDELVTAFGEEVAATIKLTAYELDDEEMTDKVKQKGPTLAHVIEIWDKLSKKVIFVSEGNKDAPLKTVPDPLQLQGFFPVPEPLQFVPRVKSMIPVALYTLYQDQAEELNRITSRLRYLIAALKIRGGYDATIEGLDKILKAEDNVFQKLENVASLQDGKNIDNSIWMVPVEKIYPIVQGLYQQREGVKTVIFEITGLADIMRGSSQASETLGAQNLKNQWGTLRLKNSQKAVQTYAKRCMRLMGEIAVTKFSPETILAMTGSQLPREADKQQAQMQMTQLQQQMMLSQQQQPPQSPNQPPAPPDPALQAAQQQMAQIQQFLQTPSLEEVLEMLKNDMLRAYRVDIETNSTVDANATEDKADMGELMNAIAQFMNGMGPLVQSGSMSMDVVKAFLLSIVRMYRFGTDVEDMIKALQPPAPPPQEQPKGPSPEVLQLQQQTEMQRSQNEQLRMKMDMEIAHTDHQNKMDEMARKAQMDKMNFEQKMALAQSQHQQKLQQNQQQMHMNQQKAHQSNQNRKN